MSHVQWQDRLGPTALFDRVTPRVRTLIADATSKAMRGGLAEAVEELGGSETNASEVDVIALALTRAYLMHLDRQAGEALKIMDGEVLPKAFALPQDIKAVLEQDRVTITFSGGLRGKHDVEQHYGQVDRRRLLGLTFRDANAVLSAADDSAAGKHYDSLPIYSSMLFLAYRYGNWSGIRSAAEDLCRELLLLGNPEEAVFYALLSEEKNSAHAVADFVRAANDAAVLDAVVSKLTDWSHLSHHTTIACEFLHRLTDAIPDRFVGTWLDRLKVVRSYPGGTLLERWASDPAWAATGELVMGASPAQTDEIVGEVIRHPLWALNDIARRQLFPVLKSAAAVCTEIGCKQIVEAVLPHVTKRPVGHDFDQALLTLMAVASRFPSLRDEMSKALYVRDGGPVPSVLAAVASTFDAQIRIEADQAVTRAIEHLRVQVEHVAEGQTPRTGFGECMTQSKPCAGGAIVVKLGSCGQEVSAIASHRKNIPSTLLADLVRAMLETICNPENLNANRVMLFSAVREFGDSLSADLASEARNVAKQFADDHRDVGHPLYGQDEEHAKLNPTRMGMGWPQEVRGEALLTLAALARHHADVVLPSLVELLPKALGDPNSHVRRYSYYAVAIAGPRVPDWLPAVVGGTRDSDPTAANFALQAVGELAAHVATAGLVSSVLGVIETQFRHPDVGVRFATARVVRQLRDALTHSAGSELQRLKPIAERLGMDVSRRVRDAISERAC